MHARPEGAPTPPRRESKRISNDGEGRAGINITRPPPKVPLGVLRRGCPRGLVGPFIGMGEGGGVFGRAPGRLPIPSEAGEIHLKPQ